MASLSSGVVAAIAVVSVPLGLYLLFIFLSLVPYFQRFALYAHKINTLFWFDVNEPQIWGFAKNQVTPFGLKTGDGETIYAWYILPLTLYHQHEERLAAESSGFCPDINTRESFRLLKEDPNAKLVLCFHGNAGHIAQALRPNSYHALTDTSSYHVVAIDYRGFGHSTGSPDEAGLIEDASTLVDWAIKVARVPPRRIVLLGQSLGTAVASGVCEKFAERGVEFAGIVLVAGFSDLASMLSQYRIAGLIPVLAPFRLFPPLLRLFQSCVVDKWNSAQRLASVVQHTRTRLRLNLIHAKDDSDIPWTEDNKLFRAAVSEAVDISNDLQFDDWKAERTISKGENAFVTTWKSPPNIVIRQELVPYGGHNPIIVSSAVALAVMQSFELEGTEREPN